MSTNNDKTSNSGRREFLGGTLGIAAGAAVGVATASLLGAASVAQAQPPAGPPAGPAAGGPPPGAGGPPPAAAAQSPRLFRAEVEIRNCEVEGKIPSDLSGAFYRVGPDAQFPLRQGNIPFDGEGHVGMFRIKNGRVDYKTRFVRNQRWEAQDKAGKLLFPMYRNPSLDDPSVKGLSRSTANTHIINHKNMLLCLKEDSPPSAIDLLTLDMVDPVYKFDGQLNSQSFTAHPKVDSKTGNMVAFGYESEGFGSDIVTAFEVTPQGKKVWEAKVKVPYVGMLHDFAVTDNYVVIYVIPMVMDKEQMAKGGIHWAWDAKGDTYFGAFRRDGNGSDIRWIKGPHRSATHVMGAWDDKGKIFVDVEMSLSNPFPFMPMQGGLSWDPAKGSSHITRLSANFNDKSPKDYGIEQLAPWVGALPRQDDRYNTQPYRYGFLGSSNINAPQGQRGNACYVRFDHSTGKQDYWDAGVGAGLAECCFAPKSKDAAEGEGYLMGVVTRQNEGGRTDLVILDAQHLSDGPVATVKLPVRNPGQVHGWWVREDQMPQA
jgi:carotenoid cleavage dioxygenase-like enzyme